MSKGLLALIGCITGEHYGWKPILETDKTDGKKKSKSHLILKELKS